MHCIQIWDDTISSVLASEIEAEIVVKFVKAICILFSTDLLWMIETGNEEAIKTILGGTNNFTPNAKEYLVELN